MLVLQSSLYVLQAVTQNLVRSNEDKTLLNYESDIVCKTALSWD